MSVSTSTHSKDIYSLYDSGYHLHCIPYSLVSDKVHGENIVHRPESKVMRKTSLQSQFRSPSTMSKKDIVSLDQQEANELIAALQARMSAMKQPKRPRSPSPTASGSKRRSSRSSRKSSRKESSSISHLKTDVSPHNVVHSDPVIQDNTHQSYSRSYYTDNVPLENNIYTQESHTPITLVCDDSYITDSYGNYSQNQQVLPLDHTQNYYGEHVYDVSQQQVIPPTDPIAYDSYASQDLVYDLSTYNRTGEPISQDNIHSEFDIQSEYLQTEQFQPLDLSADSDTALDFPVTSTISDNLSYISQDQLKGRPIPVLRAASSETAFYKSGETVKEHYVSSSSNRQHQDIPGVITPKPKRSSCSHTRASTSETSGLQLDTPIVNTPLVGKKLTRPFPTMTTTAQEAQACTLFGTLSTQMTTFFNNNNNKVIQDQPIAAGASVQQPAEMFIPAEFDSLLHEATKVAGITAIDLIPEPLPNGSHLLRLPSNPPEIQKHYETLDTSLTMGNDIIPSRYPLQPQFVHRVHTASHVSHPVQGVLATPRLSAVPVHLAILREVKPPTIRAPVVSWPLSVAKEVELSVQHSLDANYHQDLLQTVSINSMHGILDQVLQIRELGVTPSPDIMNSLMQKIGLAISALNSSVELQDTAYQHLTFSHASLELARRHRLLHITRFKPQVSQDDIASLHLSPVGTTDLVSASTCKLIKKNLVVIPTTENITNTPIDSSVLQESQDSHQDHSDNDTTSNSGQSQISSVEISSEQQALLTKVPAGLSSTVISSKQELSLEEDVVRNTSIQDTVVVKDSSVTNNSSQESVVRNKEIKNDKQDIPITPDIIKNK